MIARRLPAVGLSLVFARIEADAYPNGPLTFAAYHNTLVGPGAGTGILVPGDSTTGTVLNTLIAGFSVGISDTFPVTTALNASYTLFDTSVGTAGNASFSHSVFGPAAFVNPAGRDYHITIPSAARDAGLTTFVSTDFDGDARPIGLATDIGADEVHEVLLFLPFARR